MTVRPPFKHSVKLPLIKLEPLTGYVETWSRFWEQFEFSIEKDPTLLTTNNHVFLRGLIIPVEAGSNTSTVALRVVGGDEKGSLESERVKCGREFNRTRTQE
jgi:hypothetical protein